MRLSASYFARAGNAGAVVRIENVSTVDCGHGLANVRDQKHLEQVPVVLDYAHVLY